MSLVGDLLLVLHSVDRNGKICCVLPFISIRMNENHSREEIVHFTKKLVVDNQHVFKNVYDMNLNEVTWLEAISLYSKKNVKFLNDRGIHLIEEPFSANRLSFIEVSNLLFEN